MPLYSPIPTQSSLEVCLGRREINREKKQQYGGARPVQTSTLDRGEEGGLEVGRAGLKPGRADT